MTYLRSTQPGTKAHSMCSLASAPELPLLCKEPGSGSEGSGHLALSPLQRTQPSTLFSGLLLIQI